MGGLVFSGIAALPLRHEAAALHRWTITLGLPPFVINWLMHVENGLAQTDHAFPFIAYGTDWLAFGHFIIAIFMIGAWRDPVRNLWLFRAGQIACLLVIPTAIICGAIRSVPWWWRAIDCSFGVIGFIPLRVAERLARGISSNPAKAQIAL